MSRLIKGPETGRITSIEALVIANYLTVVALIVQHTRDAQGRHADTHPHIAAQHLASTAGKVANEAVAAGGGNAGIAAMDRTYELLHLYNNPQQALSPERALGPDLSVPDSPGSYFTPEETAAAAQQVRGISNTAYSDTTPPNSDPVEVARQNVLASFETHGGNHDS